MKKRGANGGRDLPITGSNCGKQSDHSAPSWFVGRRDLRFSEGKGRKIKKKKEEIKQVVSVGIFTNLFQYRCSLLLVRRVGK